MGTCRNINPALRSVPRSLERPGCPELRETLSRQISVTAVAKHYSISFTTAKNWLLACGLQDVLDDQSHKAAIRNLEEERPKLARRAAIERELETLLQDVGDRKLLARAIVDEFSMGYRTKKNGRRVRHTLALEVNMYDPPPVCQVAELMGVPYRRHWRKAKDGTPVPYWETRAEGYRAYTVIRLIRPYLVGQKASQADIVLRAGPLPEQAVDTGLWEYKRRVFEENKLDE